MKLQATAKRIAMVVVYLGTLAGTYYAPEYVTNIWLAALAINITNIREKIK